MSTRGGLADASDATGVDVPFSLTLPTISEMTAFFIHRSQVQYFILGSLMADKRDVVFEGAVSYALFGLK